MRHGKKNRKFGRKANVRRGFVRSLAIAFITHEKITTTEARAKELRPYIERMITKAKNDTIANRRMISSRLGNQETITKRLFEDIAPRYKDVSGGYTRITKLPERKGDASKMAVIELVA